MLYASTFCNGTAVVVRTWNELTKRYMNDPYYYDTERSLHESKHNAEPALEKMFVFDHLVYVDKISQMSYNEECNDESKIIYPGLCKKDQRFQYDPKKPGKLLSKKTQYVNYILEKSEQLSKDEALPDARLTYFEVWDALKKKVAMQQFGHVLYNQMWTILSITGIFPAEYATFCYTKHSAGPGLTILESLEEDDNQLGMRIVSSWMKDKKLSSIEDKIIGSSTEVPPQEREIGVSTSRTGGEEGVNVTGVAARIDDQNSLEDVEKLCNENLESDCHNSSGEKFEKGEVEDEVDDNHEDDDNDDDEDYQEEESEDYDDDDESYTPDVITIMSDLSDDENNQSRNFGDVSGLLTQEGRSDLTPAGSTTQSSAKSRQDQSSTKSSPTQRSSGSSPTTRLKRSKPKPSRNSTKRTSRISSTKKGVGKNQLTDKLKNPTERDAFCNDVASSLISVLMKKVGIKGVSHFFIENLLCELHRLRSKMKCNWVEFEKKMEMVLSTKISSIKYCSVPDCYYSDNRQGHYMHLFRVDGKTGQLYMRPANLKNTPTNQIIFPIRIVYDKKMDGGLLGSETISVIDISSKATGGGHDVEREQDIISRYFYPYHQQRDGDNLQDEYIE